MSGLFLQIVEGIHIRSSRGSAASTRTSRSGWAGITAPPPRRRVRAKSSG